MKKLLTTLLILTALAALAVPARADVIWEPDNRFYNTHQDQCEYTAGRAYYANGKDGFVTLWDAPGGSSVAMQLENGERLYIQWRYEDWGYAERDNGGGWVPMEDLYLIYDYISFAEDHAADIRPYAGEFADYAGDAEAVSFFSYPGAPEIQYTYSLADWGEALLNLTGGPDRESYIQSVYVDENGLTWGFVGYMYGRLNAWFCLDDPAAAGMMTSCIPEAEDLISAGELTAPQTPRLPARGYTPYLLVGAVVIVTGGALAVFFRKKKKA